MPPPLHTLKIWGAGVNSPRSYGAEFVFFVCLFVCPSRYDAKHRKPRRCVYALNLGGTGISPPDSFSYRSNFRFRSRFRSRSSSITSGDIFYCSGSRQLNHSSSLCSIDLDNSFGRVIEVDNYIMNYSVAVPGFRSCAALCKRKSVLFLCRFLSVSYRVVYILVYWLYGYRFAKAVV